MTTTLEGQSIWTTTEPTLEQILSGDYTLPVNFKVVDAETSTYKTISFVFDSVNGARRLELGGGSLDQDNIFKVMNITLEDLGLTQDSTEEQIKQALSNHIEGLQIEQKELYLFQIDGFPNGGGGATGDFIPLTGTEEGKNITGPLKFDNLNISSEKTITDGSSIFSSSIRTSLLKEGKNFETSSSFESKLATGSSEDYDFSHSTTSLNTSGSILNFSQIEYYDNFGNRTANTYWIDISSDDNAETKFNGIIGGKLTEESALTEEHFVQKAYVDKSNSYSSGEVKTSSTWIDGKPIYRNVFDITLDSNGENFISIPGIETIVGDIKGNFEYYGAKIPIGLGFQRMRFIRPVRTVLISTKISWSFRTEQINVNGLYDKQGDVTGDLFNQPMTNSTGTIIVEYTKTN